MFMYLFICLTVERVGIRDCKEGRKVGRKSLSPIFRISLLCVHIGRKEYIEYMDKMNINRVINQGVHLEESIALNIDCTNI